MDHKIEETILKIGKTTETTNRIGITTNSTIGNPEAQTGNHADKTGIIITTQISLNQDKSFVTFVTSLVASYRSAGSERNKPICLLCPTTNSPTPTLYQNNSFRYNKPR